MRFLNCIQSMCCKQGDNARLDIQRDKQEVTTSYDLDLQLCKCCVLAQFTTDALQIQSMWKRPMASTFRITVTEWETFCDHLPTWLVLICIQSRDLQSDLTCGEICAPNTNSRTFPNKLFFPGCMLIINVYGPISLSGTGTTTLF